MSETQGVGFSGRKPYGGRPHKSHCTCWNENERLRAALAESQAEVERLRAQHGSELGCVVELYEQKKADSHNLQETVAQLKAKLAEAYDDSKSAYALLTPLQATLAETQQELHVMRQMAADLEQAIRAVGAERDRYKAVVDAARKWRNEGGGWAAPAAADLRRALAALDAPSPAHTPGCQCHGCLDSAGHRAYTAAAEQERPAVYPGSDNTMGGEG